MKITTSTIRSTEATQVGNANLGGAVFFKPGFTGLTASKPGFDYVRPAGGRYRLLISPLSVEYLSMSEIRDIEKVANSYTVM